jgi:hypothetical protein
LTRVEHSCPGRQLRGYVHHDLAVGDQALGEVFADAVAALDRPDPVLMLPAEFEHRLVAVVVGAEPPLREDLLAVADDLDRRGSFVGIHTDDDLSHACLFLDRTGLNPTRRAALLRAEQSPLEPLRATVTGRTHAMSESHQHAVDSR